MTDEIERVREAFNEALAEYCRTGGSFNACLAKRLQPKPTPAPKVWSVSEGTEHKYRIAFDPAWTNEPFVDAKMSRLAALNAIVDDILRDRPDAVAKEWERRWRDAFPGDTPEDVDDVRRALFPEVEG